ncbi:hypothetical protein HaLaN_19640 [Haematococcus lacustris]|uniref:Secreted protein n=1 Tax=Haematococcus lacustris TaxID=44745 RepID=A0A6A0A0G7_HAELA|nr:hypothetical protein HaLaN_19640 [Haematococcus lacustris]
MCTPPCIGTPLLAVGLQLLLPCGKSAVDWAKQHAQGQGVIHRTSRQSRTERNSEYCSAMRSDHAQSSSLSMLACGCHRLFDALARHVCRCVCATHGPTGTFAARPCISAPCTTDVHPFASAIHCYGNLAEYNFLRPGPLVADDQLGLGHPGSA